MYFTNGFDELILFFGELGSFGKNLFFGGYCMLGNGENIFNEFGIFLDAIRINFFGRVDRDGVGNGFEFILGHDLDRLFDLFLILHSKLTNKIP